MSDFDGKQREQLRRIVATTFADPKAPYTVDEVAVHLQAMAAPALAGHITRELVNELAPWDRAELDSTNSTLYTVQLEGDPVEWEFRDDAAYYDEAGRPRTGKDEEGHAPKLVKPAYARVQLRARSAAEAKAAALATHPGFYTVTSAEKAKE